MAETLPPLERVKIVVGHKDYTKTLYCLSLDSFRADIEVCTDRNDYIIRTIKNGKSGLYVTPKNEVISFETFIETYSEWVEAK